MPITVNRDPAAEGHKETFWVSNLIEGNAGTISATLRVVSEHAYWYSDDSIDLPIEDLRRAAGAFETRIHPLITGSFGDIWNPGVDNDPRLTVLHTPLPGLNGYFSSQNEYHHQIEPHSNEREMIYMDGGRLNPGSSAYLATLTHEFQHAVHLNLGRGEESWLNEGMSEVARELAGYRVGSANSYLLRTSTQLNYWPGNLAALGPHYGASALFLSYLAQHYGGYESLIDIVREPEDGIDGIDAYLERYSTTFLEVFKDWVLANYLDAPEGPWGYPESHVQVRDVDRFFVYGEKSEALPQFSARYIDLRLGRGDALVSFHGDSEVGQVGTRCYSAPRCWWGNRGDSIDSTLTREFDLTGLDNATLEFWTWFRMERSWDHAYVEVSPDGGATWTILEGIYTTPENPVGNNFGNGITGRSNGWVQERMDLSTYAGERILLRFEYVTDEGVYLDGFLIDDVAIPELGFFDDGGEDRGWLAEGFVLTDTRLPQHYAVQVIKEGAPRSA